MLFPTLAARLASATLLATLTFAAAGAGTAAAANSNLHASINIVVTPASAAQIGPGASFTDTFLISDPDNEGTKDVTILMSYPATVQLQGVQFNRAGPWVDSAMPNGIEAKLGDIGSHGDSVAMKATFIALPGYSAGSPLQAQLESSWHDVSSSGNHHNISSAPLLAGAAQLSMAAGASTGVVNVAVAGFTPGEFVTFWYNLPDGSAAPLYVRNGQLTTDKVFRNGSADASGNRDVANETGLYADANGRINTNFATTGLTPGAYSIVAHGMADGVDSVVLFNV